MELLFLWLLCGVVGGLILSRFDKAGTGCVLGVLLGPIGVIITAVMRSNAQAAETQKRHEESLAQMATMASPPSPEEAPKEPKRVERECPFCAEPILAKAKICKHCGREVEAEIRAELQAEIRAELQADD